MPDDSDQSGDTRADLLLRAAGYAESLHETLLKLWRLERRGMGLGDRAATEYREAVEAQMRRLPADGTEPEIL